MVGYVIKDKLKKAFSIMVIIITFAFMIVLVTGCENENDKQQQEVVKKTYTVTFDSTGGSLVESQTVTEGETLTRPTTPTKEGYEFLGWTYNGENYLFSSPVNSDMTLVATWAEKEQVWVVTLNLDDGSLNKKVNVKKGEKLEKPETPSRDGYDFISWQLDGKDYDFNKVVEKDITLKATWKEKKLKITFDTKGGTAVAAQEVSINGVVKAPKEPTKNGWTFVEWQFEGKKYDFKEEVKTNMTLVAKWKLTQTYQKEESVTKKLNGKNVKIDFRYINKNDKEEVDVFVNDIKTITMVVEIGEAVGAEDPFIYYAQNKNELLSKAQEMVSYVKQELKVVKGDKEYLTIQHYNGSFKIAVINDNGVIVYNDNPIDSYMGAGFNLDTSCPNYDKFIVGESKIQHYYNISNDGIYYLNKYTGSQINEYKLTIKNNKVTTSKIATCLGFTVNSNRKAVEYVLEKTKKVNGKDVPLSYIFIGDDELGEITISLQVHDKLIEENLFAETLLEEEYEKIQVPDTDASMQFASKFFKEWSTLIDEKIGVISGDKEYLYVLGQNKIIVLDNNYNKIFNKKMLYFNDRGVYLENTCPNVDKFKVGGSPIYSGYTNTNLYYIAKDAIYYIEDNGSCPSEVEGLTLEESEQLPQYKVTFKNNAANMEKIATCKYTAEGNCH